MQDAFLKLWERWDRIDTIDDPVAYLFRSALNGSRMRMRRTRMAARRVVPVASARDPFDDVNVREDVRRMLRGLPPRQRAAVVLTESDTARIPLFGRSWFSPHVGGQPTRRVAGALPIRSAG